MSSIQFFNLSIPAPKRLNMMRRAGHTDWRTARAYRLDTWRDAFGAGIHQAPKQWYTHAGEQFRNERDAEKVSRSMNHSGWYTDSHQSELAIGIVASLPHGRFLAGYRWTCNDERVYFPEVFTDEREAARRADSHAESFAESSREHSERFDAMQDAESAVDDARKACKLACMARNVSPEHREIAAESIETLREALDTLSDATRAYERG